MKYTSLRIVDTDNVADSELSNAKYWAFISYSSKDKKIAKKLHAKLESYKIPKGLVGRPGRGGAVPRKLFPVFRDRDELPLSSDLGSSIHDALRVSRYLIVICSPNAAGSRWVNEEIKYFKQIGREDQILAIINDGEPGATDMPGREHEEAFPEALRHVVSPQGEILEERCEPIAGDLRKGGDGWTRCFLKAVAGITGLGYDAFAHREAKRARVKRIVLAFAALIALIAGVWSWDYYRVKKTYFRYLTFQHGEPIGLGVVSDDQMKHRIWTYCLESSRRKVRKVTVVDALGGLRELYAVSPEFEPFSKLEISYREDGSVASHTYYDLNNLELLKLEFSEDLKIVSRKVPGKGASSALDELSGSVATAGWFAPIEDLQQKYRSKIDISSYEFSYDGDGFVKQLLFLNAYGVMTANTDGAFGLRFERGSHGEVIAITSLDQDAQPVAAATNKVVTMRIRYDENMDEVSKWLEDIHGKKTNGPAQFCEMRIKRDAYGNDIVRSVFDASGKPALRNSAHHQVRITMEENGNYNHQAYFGVRGEKATFENKGVHEWLYHYRGCRNVGQENIGIDGKLVMDGDGVAVYVNTLDQQGRVIETRYFDTDRKPTIEYTSGSHIVRYGFSDATSRDCDSVSYFDTEGKPMLGIGGYHKVEYIYNRMRLVSRETYFGMANEPIIIPDAGHVMKRHYDNQGNLSSSAIFGTDGEPITDSHGVHEYRTERDNYGRELSTTYYGIDGRMVIRTGNSYAKYSYEYLDNGRVTVTRYWDVNGKKCVSKEGGHMEVTTRNKAGKVLSYENFGVDGKPCYYASSGYHKKVFLYGKYGFIISERYFGIGADGGIIPIILKGGFHERRLVHSREGFVLEESFFGPHGEEVINLKRGFHKQRSTFSADGLITESSYWATGGKKGTAISKVPYHRVKMKYNSARKIYQFQYYMKDGKPSRDPGLSYIKRFFYDQFGNITEIQYRGVNQELVNNTTTGYAIEKMKMRRNGDLLEKSFYDKDRKPIMLMGHHLIRQEYDSQGRLLWARYFGIKGNQIINPKVGYAGMHRTYDTKGRIKRESYHGVGDVNMELKNRLHAVDFSYDIYGNWVSRRHYDNEFHRVKSTMYEVYEIRRKFSPTNQLTEMSFFGADGTPMNCVFGYHAERSDTSQRGIRVKSYWAQDGTPAIHSRYLYHKAVSHFNEVGQILKYEKFDIHGNLTNGSTKFSTHEYHYDRLYRLKEVRVYDPKHQLMFRREFYYVEGSATLKETRDFDAQGNRI